MSKCGDNAVSQQCHNNLHMVIDTFISKQDRRRIALSFGYDLPVA